MQLQYDISKQQVYYINYNQPWHACISPTKLTSTAVLWQNGLLLWIQIRNKLLNSYIESVGFLEQKSMMESRRYFGRDLAVIIVPYSKQQIDWLFQNSNSWAIVFVQFEGQINNL